MRNFLFLRHGETDWNVARRMQGRIRDIQLNETGIKQASAAAAFLAGHPFDLIISSPLDRAAVTAQIIAERKGHSVVFDERLVERDWGAAEGLTHEEINAADPTAFFADNGRKDWMAKMRQPKGSETKKELMDRATTTLFDLLSRYKEQRLLLVTHGAWIRALVLHLAGIDEVFPNAVPYVASEDPEGWKVKLL